MNQNETAANQTYTQEVKRSTEADRKVQDLKKACADFDVKLVPPENIESYLKAREALAEAQGCSNRALIEKVEKDVTEYSEFILQQ